MDKHRSDYKRWKNNVSCYVSAFDVFDTYGLENCQIILLESCPCNTKDELLSREGYFIKNLVCCNRNIPSRTKEEIKRQIKVWSINNKEKIVENRKIYYQTNKEKIEEKRKIYDEINKDKISHRQKKYDEINTERISDINKIYRENSLEKIYLNKKIWNLNNKEEINRKRREHNKLKKMLNANNELSPQDL